MKYMYCKLMNIYVILILYSLVHRTHIKFADITPNVCSYNIFVLFDRVPCVIVGNKADLRMER